MKKLNHSNFVKRPLRIHIYYILIILLFFSQCGEEEDDNYTTIFPRELEIPQTLQSEHKELLNQINELSLYDDSTGIVATEIKDLMIYHFKSEEEFVFPQLAYLPVLVNGNSPDEIKKLIELSEKLESNLAFLSAEHQMITEYVKKLKRVTSDSQLPEIIAFEKELIEHAEREEAIYFPTAILIGKYLELIKS